MAAHTDHTLAWRHRPVSSFVSGHLRHNSGELEVFEAARYFSDDIPAAGSAATVNPPAISFPTAVVVEEDKLGRMREGHRPLPSDRPIASQEKPLKHPSSPAARLAGYFNSFILQKTPISRRPKCLPVAKDPTKQEEDPQETSKSTTNSSHGGRRRKNMTSRNDVITHCDSKRSSDSRSTHSCVEPTTFPFKRSDGLARSFAINFPRSEIWEEKKAAILCGSGEKNSIMGGHGYLERLARIYGGNGSVHHVEDDGFSENKWVLNKDGSDRWQPKKESSLKRKQVKKAVELRGKGRTWEEEEGGGAASAAGGGGGCESDSSSDLFELRNFDALGRDSVMAKAKVVGLHHVSSSPASVASFGF